MTCKTRATTYASCNKFALRGRYALKNLAIGLGLAIAYAQGKVTAAQVKAAIDIPTNNTAQWAGIRIVQAIRSGRVTITEHNEAE